jgi:PKD repeat protein
MSVPNAPTLLTASCVDYTVNPSYADTVPSIEQNISIDIDNADYKTINLMHEFKTGETCYWDFGDGTTATGCSAEHTYAHPGTYRVKLIVCNALGCITSYQMVYIDSDSVINTPNSESIFHYPTPGYFTVSTPYAGTGVNINFSGPSATSCGDYSYDWDWGDGTAHGTTQNPIHQYSSYGIYYVTLTFMCDDITTTYVFPIIITPETDISRMPPLINEFSATPQVGMVPLEVEFVCTTLNASSFIWNFGDGEVYSTASQDPITHIYYKSGIYHVRVDLLNSFGAVYAELDIVVIGWSSVDGNDVIGYYIVDTPNDRVLMFTKLGAYLGYFGRYGSGEGQFNEPTQLTAINATQKIDKITFD